ncbi:DeoR/GlpR family DNA-binding transcription regulator [Actinopolymorpha sp. B17G11]|uniref:DeoR/GlpR family DNA-binding transcription regulator n=1 Tax=unclassified Actinopolymorpha TaxID=2627063 RepID=UPI0032D8F1D7
MNRYERLNAILELVAERSQIDVETLAEELDVSTATIRRDLDHLAQQQFLTRTRGGAVAHSVAYDLPLRYKTARLASEKQRIGKAAADLVTAGMVIGINGGTTATEVARAIATRSDLRSPNGGRRAVTIVTNAVNIANELTVRPHVKIVVTGGVARPQSYELAGPLATHILEGVSLDMAILGADGISPEHGASAHHEGEAMINQLMAARSRQVVVVADSSKIGAQAFARIRRTEEIDLLITDFGGPEESIRLFEEAGVKVMRV